MEKLKRGFVPAIRKTIRVKIALKLLTDIGKIWLSDELARLCASGARMEHTLATDVTRSSAIA